LCWVLSHVETHACAIPGVNLEGYSRKEMKGMRGAVVLADGATPELLPRANQMLWVLMPFQEFSAIPFGTSVRP